jgi:hypothetical protein
VDVVPYLNSSSEIPVRLPAACPFTGGRVTSLPPNVFYVLSKQVDTTPPFIRDMRLSGMESYYNPITKLLGK